MAVVNIKLFIYENCIKSRGTAAVIRAVTRESVAPLPYKVIFTLTLAILGHSVQIEYMKNTQGQMLRSISVVHSGNSAHSGKRTHKSNDF